MRQLYYGDNLEVLRTKIATESVSALSYLVSLTQRIIETHRVLKPTQGKLKIDKNLFD